MEKEENYKLNPLQTNNAVMRRASAYRSAKEGREVKEILETLNKQSDQLSRWMLALMSIAILLGAGVFATEIPVSWLWYIIGPILFVMLIGSLVQIWIHDRIDRLEVLERTPREKMVLEDTLNYYANRLDQCIVTLNGLLEAWVNYQRATRLSDLTSLGTEPQIRGWLIRLHQEFQRHGEIVVLHHNINNLSDGAEKTAGSGGILERIQIKKPFDEHNEELGELCTLFKIP